MEKSCLERDLDDWEFLPDDKSLLDFSHGKNEGGCATGSKAKPGTVSREGSSHDEGTHLIWRIHCKCLIDHSSRQ
ncbi:hypothetical protein C4D60_Mb04t29300 [Musa balbisiana]|uniref:Uncharacterized protein n=1 Tax=Musa balbisiana TaxID=52838 RepID=A0A4S8KFP0_MUSBA|nr:hypothetical protein C4D60_Mb04t29300 [Musa balbisiana]